MSQEIECPSCGEVFEVEFTDWLNHDGDESDEQCPSCLKRIRVVATITVDIDIKEKK